MAAVEDLCFYKQIKASYSIKMCGRNLLKMLNKITNYIHSRCTDNQSRSYLKHLSLTHTHTHTHTCTYTYRDIPWSEEELSVKVGFLYDVHVSDPGFTSLTTRDSHQCPVLQHLTPDSACTNLQTDRHSHNVRTTTFHTYMFKNSYCMRTLTRYYRINYMDNCITK